MTSPSCSYRDARLDRWEEQLAAHTANVCDCEEPCPPCARCHHAFCRHEDDGFLARQCLSSGCHCRMWLSDTDCRYCDGQRVVSRSYVPAGRILEDDQPCPWCGGTGMSSSNDS